MKRKNIAINGLGRIGKSVFRRYFEHKYDELKLVVINLGESNIESKLKWNTSLPSVSYRCLN